MSSNWTIIDTGVASAEENMRLDAHLLDSLSLERGPILHFYDWEEESATYGLLVDPSDFLDLAEVKKRGISLAKRPTGGGIVFHIWDLAFSVLVPSSSPLFSKNTLENYALINRAVLKAAKELLSTESDPELILGDASPFDSSCQRFCMAQPTKYDVVLGGRKIAGAAQRKTKGGFLHQGTIALKSPNLKLLRALLLPGTKVLEAIEAHTFPLLPIETSLGKGRQEIKQLLTKHLTQEEVHVTSR